MLKAAATKDDDAAAVRRTEAAVKAGLRLAQQAGKAEPGLRDAIWEVLLEAAETLRRLPDRERGWLTAASRAHWPDYVRETAAICGGSMAAGARSGPRPAPAGAAAIERLDTVLLWLPQAGGAHPRRDVSVLFGLACGARAAALQRRLGCGRRTIYDIRDRSLARICAWLRQQSDFCRGLG